MSLTHLHDRPADLPFPARTAQEHAMMIRKWISLHKVWMRENPRQSMHGRDRLRELVGIFREDCASIDAIEMGRAMRLAEAAE